MIAYGIGILPLIKNLKRDIPDVTQALYDEDAGSLGTSAIIETYFDFLKRQGPVHGYYLKPSKSLLILHPDNIKVRKEFGAHHGFKLCMGACYLGGYIGDDESKSDFLR